MQLLIFVLVLSLKGIQCLDLDSFYKYVIKEESNSSTCQTQKIAFLEALENRETWALTGKFEVSNVAKEIWLVALVLDAFGRVPQSVTRGNHRDLGLFDQCVGILQKTNTTTVRGKYCLNGLLVPVSSTGSLLFNVDDDDPKKVRSLLLLHFWQSRISSEIFIFSYFSC